MQSHLTLSSSIPVVPPFQILLIWPHLYDHVHDDIPHGKVCLGWSSNFVSILSTHSAMLSHCISSRTLCASTIVAIVVILWCNCTTFYTCCLIFLSSQLLQAPAALANSKVLLLGAFPLWFCSNSLLAAMKESCVIFPVLVPAAQLSPPAYTLSISVSMGGFPTIPANSILTLSDRHHHWLAGYCRRHITWVFGLLQSS